MSKELVIGFLKDKMVILVLYLVNSITLIFFFNLIHPEKIEFLYPMVISFFLLITLLIVEWSKYARQQTINKNYHQMNKEYVEEISELKSNHEERVRFLYQWIHNLKTPIAVIELIIDKYSAREIIPSDALKNIRVENNRLHNSIEQVLHIIRFENFAQDYEANASDLISSLNKVINEKKNQFIYNKVFPMIKTDLERANIITDKKWNEIILDQIISNAIKYSSDGVSSKKIVFSITKDRDYIKLTIKDEGVGIPKYDLKRVFEPFFTGENGRKFKNSTGIGLYLSKQIGDRLGHSIQIRSEVSNGTEVTIQYLAKM